MTARSWVWSGLMLFQLALSVAAFFGPGHDATLRAIIAVYWVVFAWLAAPVLAPGFRHGPAGIRDAVNSYTGGGSSLGAGAGTDRSYLTLLVVGLAAGIGYCLWLAYATH